MNMVDPFRPAAVFSAAIMAMAVLASSPAAAQSRSYCDAYARDYANSRTNPAGNALGGAAVGAVGGAVLGGILGGGRGARRGAVIGGGVGAVGGAASSGRDWQYHYDVAYADCRDGRGARSQPVYQPARPEPWTDDWYAYCGRKYNSFDPSDGTFQPYDGPRRLCR